MVDARLASQGSVDWFVLEFEEALPPVWQVAYGDEPMAGGCVAPQLSAGAFLNVRAYPSAATDYHGQPPRASYQGPKRLETDTRAIREALFTCDLEGGLTWALVLDRRVPFRVEVLASPPRLLIEVQSTATTELDAPSECVDAWRTGEFAPPQCEEYPEAYRRFTSAARLRLDGIGPVGIGMTTAEASRASGKSIRVDPASSPHPSFCAFATVEGGPDIAFMVISDRIQRVDVGPESSVRTVSGVGIGDSEDEVQRIYGDRTRVEPHPYDEEGRYLVYDSPEPSQRGLLLIFETDGTRVTSFRAGERGAVEAPEGCV